MRHLHVICCAAHVVLLLVVLILIVSFTLDYDTRVLLYADYSHKPDPHTPHFMDKCMERRSVPLPIPVDPAGQLASHIQGKHNK